jgi:CheY-like chemotaxis protein
MPCAKEIRATLVAVEDGWVKRVRILVVDDEIHVASLLAEAIRRQGHDVTIAQDAQEALVLLDHLRPDGLFLDIALGEVSGLEVLRRLRQVDRRLPVVIITGHAEASQLDEARRLGVTDILEKPILLNHLTEAVIALSETR